MTTNRTIRALLLAIALGLWANVAANWVRPVILEAQGTPDRRSLFIGEQEFWIGMSKNEVDKRLQACCKPLSNEEGAFIEANDNKTLGAVWFKSGRVSGLRRDELRASETEAVALGLKMFRLVSQLGNGSAQITTDTLEATNATLRTITMAFPDGNTLEVWHSQSDAGGARVELKVSRR